MYTNRLSKETSPYLLQHAHNPVDWYPWGEEALEKAKSENKPILVSIGYSACHWCHVMERESFENVDVAAIMNQKFINIKIDREERPDIDQIYMDAVQVMTGSGGWPLNVFLTSDCKPFYGGTYFPPVRAFNRSSWREVLHSVSEAFNLRRNEVEDQANNLTLHLKQNNTLGTNTQADNNFTTGTVATIAENLLQAADKVWGGFGNAPKFPQTFSISYLLKHYYFTKDEKALDQALLSIDKMIFGGIYDQLGGGFARYSTDREWLAPHFEKMLYDNALLLGNLCEAYQITGKSLYADAIRDTVQFIRRELTHPDGGFYSALDADSEGVEGKFYTWSKAEIIDTLGDESELFCAFYDVSEHGNWEETNILRVLLPVEAFAEKHHLDPQALSLFLADAKSKLLQVRNGRVRPSLDDKVLLGWNCLLITALCKCYAALGDEDYRNMAIGCINFLENNLKTEAGDAWYHTFKDGVAKYPAFLDDYAYLSQCYISLQEISGDESYLLKARDICQFVELNFSEENTGFFYYTHTNQKDVIVRKREVYDGATPSGNAVMIQNLRYLGIAFNRPDWLLRAEQTVGALSNMITKYPTSFGIWASNIMDIVYGLNEIAIVGNNWKILLKAFLRQYVPGRILQAAPDQNDNFPLLKGKKAPSETLIYLCKNYQCGQPVTTIKDLLNHL